MKTIIFFSYVLIFAACYVNLADCAQAILGPQTKPEEFAHEEGCYIPRLGKVIPYEEPYSPEDGATCVQYTCNKDGETTIDTCGKAAAVYGCDLVPGDKSLPYPDCCEKVECAKHYPVPAK